MRLQLRSTEKIGFSITTYYEQLSEFLINQLFCFKVEYELPTFYYIGLTYKFGLGLKERFTIVSLEFKSQDLWQLNEITED